MKRSNHRQPKSPARGRPRERYGRINLSGHRLRYEALACCRSVGLSASVPHRMSCPIMRVRRCAFDVGGLR
jgi:hypothetical protein